jgi:[ribosomal protein S18]-alanine N-acetyltransferase
VASHVRERAGLVGVASVSGVTRSRYDARVQTTVSIRLAKRSDAEAIALLSRTEIEYDLPWRWTPPKVANAIAHSLSNVAVAVEGNRLLGFGIMEYYEEHAHLVLFAVRPDSRRRGVGIALLRWLEDVALTAGIVSIKLEARETNLSGIAFYRRHGYREFETVHGMYRGLEDGVRLAKRVSIT